MIHYSIIKAAPNQFQEILELLHIAATDLKKKQIDQWSYWLDPPQERLDWAKKGLENKQFYFLKSQDQFIGMYRLMTEDLLYWGPQEKPSYYIHSLVVIPEFAGHNIGKQIVDHIKKRAFSNGITLLRLDCHAGNKALCAYYEKLGFQKTGQVQMPHSLNNLYEYVIT